MRECDQVCRIRGLYVCCVGMSPPLAIVLHLLMMKCIVDHFSRTSRVSRNDGDLPFTLALSRK